MWVIFVFPLVSLHPFWHYGVVFFIFILFLISFLFIFYCFIHLFIYFHFIIYLLKGRSFEFEFTLLLVSYSLRHWNRPGWDISTYHWSASFDAQFHTQKSRKSLKFLDKNHTNWSTFWVINHESYPYLWVMGVTRWVPLWFTAIVCFRQGIHEFNRPLRTVATCLE